MVRRDSKIVGMTKSISLRDGNAGLRDDYTEAFHEWISSGENHRT